jgi:xanthine dehydrogenase accessory factor
MTELLDEAAALRAARRPFVLATVVWRRAPTSGRPGAKAVVLPDGTVHGWVGGACAQPTLVRQAREAMAEGEPRLVFLGPADDSDGVLRDGVVRVPMACESEGSVEIFLEPMLPSPHVVVVGDSELTSALADLVRALDWTVTATDQPGFTADAATAVVVATQGRWDEDAVHAALETDAAYVGLVASLRRAEAVREWLEGAGVTGSQLARLRAPAGLDLGHVAHREIAAAILAELVQLHAAGTFAAGTVAAATASAQPEHAHDPVCGMLVDSVDARHVSECNGRRVFFCAASCKRAFDDDREKYAGALR